MIDRGRVIAHDTPDGLKRLIGGQRLRVRPADPDRTRRRPADPRRAHPQRSRRPAPAGELTVPGATTTRCCPHWSPARRRRHHGHRALPAPAEPRRGLPDPHRPAHRRDHRGGGMTTTIATPAGVARPHRPLASAGTPATSTLWRQARVLAQRSLIKTWRTPEALVDVTLQPIIFLLLFTYIFGGAIAGGSQQRLPAVPAAGPARADDRDGQRRARPEPERRHREGRLRPVPVAADRPLRAAGRRGPGRPRPLRDPVRGA